MKLLKIKLKSDFNSLKAGFELNFRNPYKEGLDSSQGFDQFHPFCFAGLNGSGKSNVLEALSSIFFHLESCANVNQPKNFKEQFKSDSCNPDSYELEYYINPSTKDAIFSIENMVLVKIIKRKGEEPSMSWRPYPFNGEKKRDVQIVAPKNGKVQAVGKTYLPDLVIGYSSGENEILSIPFLKTRLIHFDEYKEAVKENFDFTKPESTLVYIDYEMSQAVLLSNYLMQSNKDVLKSLKEELKIVDIKRFRMNLNIGHQLDNQPILSQYSDTIDKFKNCSTALFENDDKLILDFWINEATKEAFKKNFNDEIFELFQAFQILYTLNYRTIDYPTKSEVYGSKGYYTDGKIDTPAPRDKTFYFLDFYITKKINASKTINLLLKQLSDGEQQFLHSLGICLMLKNKSALLLLDEPETHFNPDWRSKFISILKQSLTAAESNELMRDILITSHSPFIISDCYPDKVIVFEKGKEPKNAEDLDLQTFGTSVNLLTNKIFGNRRSIAEFSYYNLNKYRKRFELGESFEMIQQEVNEKFGDSIEKLLLLKELKEKTRL